MQDETEAIERAIGDALRAEVPNRYWLCLPHFLEPVGSPPVLLSGTCKRPR